MIDRTRILGLIPARGGSKRLPRKNVLPLGGRPLITWTIGAALDSEYIDRLVLSSDDDEIIQVAQVAGCEVPFRRPAGLALDNTPTIDVVLHALKALPGFDYVVLLQPSSPFRTSSDIDRTVEKCVMAGAPSCISIVKATKPLQWMYSLGGGDRLHSVLRNISGPGMRTRDDGPLYLLNGAVYCSNTKSLCKTKEFVIEGTVGYEMPAHRSVDIDSDTDLEWCEFLLERTR